MHNFYVRSKQFVTYLLLRQTTSWRWPPFFATYLLKRLKNCQITRGTRSRFMVAIASRTAPFSSCTVCGWILYTNYFKCPNKKKFGTVRSGDRTGHGIPDTWKLLSSLINTLHITGIRCHWRGFDMARYHLFLGVQAVPPTHHRRAKERSEKYRSALRHSV